ncbi:tRNA lysidine(34) synthetase TilS [Gemmatimonadota bacterium]
MNPSPYPSGTRSLPPRFVGETRRLEAPGEGDGIVVAVSGGLDSVVLLHLLRFSPGLPALDIRAAHFDHRMRPGSPDDAAWVRGLCRAWGVPLHLGEADPPPASEEEAREARYRFLLGVFEEVGARWLLTAHHADDQAETVLFRILRGTGLPGLAGIPHRRPPGILRPLLPFTRKELVGYAGDRGIRPRPDPSNFDTRFSRNFLRRNLLPGVEETVAPRARESLRRLARLARENEEGWHSLLPLLLEGIVREDQGDLSVVRSALLAYHPAVRTRLLRELFRRRGIRLDETGTRGVLEFTTTGASGRYLTLPGGYRFSREFDDFVLRLEEEAEGERPLALPEATEGWGEAFLGGRAVRIRWGPQAPQGCGEVLEASLAALEFPLRIRGWVPGDRIFLGYGTKKLKKLFSESRVPAPARGRVPVLVDRRGRVLWVPALASSALVKPRGGSTTFFIGIEHGEST